MKLVDENKANWDEHLPLIFFSYKIAYKVVTRYTPFGVWIASFHAHRICFSSIYWGP
jgi:hypothetical protein